jgi:pantothenate synthetase
MRAVIESEPLATLGYAAVVDPGTFESWNTGANPLALAAVVIGTTRLIDNIRLN